MVEFGYAQKLWRQGYQIVTELLRHGRWWSKVIYRAIHATSQPETALLAAAIGYFTLFSLFPLTLLSVAVASFWVDPAWAENEVVTQLEFVAPAIGDLLGANISGLIRNRGPVSGIALGILLWSGSNIFNQLTRALDAMWGVPRKRSLIRRRGFAMLLAMSLSAILLVIFIAEGTIGTIVNSFIPDELEQYRPYTNQLWASFVSIGLFIALYYLLPHVSLTWRQVVPGAILAGLTWEVAKRGFLIFISAYLVRSNLVYGSVSIIIIFLLWVYVSTMIFMFGGYLNFEYTQQKEKEERKAKKEKRKKWVELESEV